jgi:hypothetical protein
MSFFNDFERSNWNWSSAITRFCIKNNHFKPGQTIARITHIIEHRTNLVVKYLHLLTNILALIAVLIWGVQKDIIIAISSITTVVGVAIRSMVYIK